MFDALADFLLPTRCLGCRGALPIHRSAEVLCPSCRTRLREPPHPRCGRCDFPVGTGRPSARTCLTCEPWPEILQRARSAIVLQPPADELVHALKYEGWRHAAPLMAERMTRALRDEDVVGGAEPVVVPVPTTRVRRRRRGYNQAALLAHEIAAARGWPLVHALRRSDGDATQVSLGPDERRANVARAFSLEPRKAQTLAGARVLLVDDVLTTGATVGAAARSLERGSVTGVTVVTFARAVPTLSLG